jgi:2-polyprenyl-3-methyl-5-hydroxy-6-metoxy-1,4-benzoquinol methylase
MMSSPLENPEAWLQENRNLRLDANHSLFPDDRRAFHLDRYLFAKAYCGGMRVLDGACGTGYGSAILGEVADAVVGIDMSEDAVTYATRTYGRENVQFKKSYVELTPFPASTFDVVVSFETVEHTLCPHAHMLEIARLLTPVHGLAIVSVPNGWGLTGHHFLDFNIDLLKDVTAPNFCAIEFFYQNPASSRQLPGIGPLKSADPSDAQCIIAVCRGPRKDHAAADRHGLIMEEIYRRAFARHADYLTLAYRHNTSLVRRLSNKVHSLLLPKPQ